MAIKKETWREQQKTLEANVVTPVEFIDTAPNVFQIRNLTAGILYIGETDHLSESIYEMQIIPGGTRVYTTAKMSGIKRLYLLSTGLGNVSVKSAASDEVYSNDLDQTMATTIINAVIPAAVTINAAIPEGSNKIGQVEIVDGDNTLNVDTHGKTGAVLYNEAGQPVGVSGNPLEVNASVSVGAVTINVPAVPLLSTRTMTNADTEYSIAIPSNCKSIRMAVRDGDSSFSYRFAFETGKVAGKVEPYKSYKGNVEYDPGGLNMAASPGSIYFACSVAGKVMEIEFWT